MKLTHPELQCELLRRITTFSFFLETFLYIKVMPLIRKMVLKDKAQCSVNKEEGQG